MDTGARVAGPLHVAAAAATVYTVPALTKLYLRNIHISNPGPDQKPFTLSIGADAADKRIFDGLPIPPFDALNIPVLIVLTAAEILQAKTSVASILTLTLSGILET